MSEATRQPGDTVWVLKHSSSLYLPVTFTAIYVGSEREQFQGEDVHRYRGWQGERKYRPKEEWTHPNWRREIRGIFDSERELIEHILPQQIRDVRTYSRAVKRLSDDAKRLQARLKDLTPASPEPERTK
jgi:hypothetical protein